MKRDGSLSPLLEPHRYGSRAALDRSHRWLGAPGERDDAGASAGEREIGFRGVRMTGCAWRTCSRGLLGRFWASEEPFFEGAACYHVRANLDGAVVVERALGRRPFLERHLITEARSLRRRLRAPDDQRAITYGPRRGFQLVPGAGLLRPPARLYAGDAPQVLAHEQPRRHARCLGQRLEFLSGHCLTAARSGRGGRAGPAEQGWGLPGDRGEEDDPIHGKDGEQDAARRDGACGGVRHGRWARGGQAADACPLAP